MDDSRGKRRLRGWSSAREAWKTVKQWTKARLAGRRTHKARGEDAAPASSRRTAPSRAEELTRQASMQKELEVKRAEREFKKLRERSEKKKSELRREFKELKERNRKEKGELKRKMMVKLKREADTMKSELEKEREQGQKLQNELEEEQKKVERMERQLEQCRRAEEQAEDRRVKLFTFLIHMICFVWLSSVVVHCILCRVYIHQSKTSDERCIPISTVLMRLVCSHHCPGQYSTLYQLYSPSDQPQLYPALPEPALAHPHHVQKDTKQDGRENSGSGFIQELGKAVVPIFSWIGVLTVFGLQFI